ncbi:uncharacterized protein LOC129599607 [Paramacrobiotus metropolitanus]|uniref:uncharacterized protein LOC129599607 n=1 Tax=Paramacrobiotus metropolitanus TaxID=2943436 RepID=UPI002445A02A|nr:uncharacterized protein LOC129599607 [Paramacrobiotus metropolitanus]
MYLYEDGERSVYTWNAVDVEIDGLLQHGHVIGLEETPGSPPRLVVDFACPTQRSVPVEYERVVACSADHYRLTPAGSDVEVLLFEHPHRPWKWFPGTVLIDSFTYLSRCAKLVEVQTDGHGMRELLPRHQVRRPFSLEEIQQRRLQPGHFVLRTCGLPDGFWALKRSLTEQWIKELQHEFQLWVTSILSGEMHYLQQRDVRPLTAEDAERCLKNERRNFRHELKRLRSKDVEKVLDEPQDETRFDAGSRGLPFEVLKEVFHSLDTMDRQCCRRTCHLWEALLSTAELRAEVRVSLARISFWSPRIQYAVFGCIMKHITPATRTVVVCQHSLESVDLQRFRYDDQPLTFLEKTLNDVGVRIDRLILYRRTTTINFYLNEPLKLRVMFAMIAAQHTRLASSCGRVIWKDYAVKWKSCCHKSVMECCVPSVVFILGNDASAAKVQIWDVCERHLCDTKPAIDVERIANCTTHLIITETRANQVKQILKDYQTCDPRPSAHYRGYKWTLSNVAGVDVRKLNKFCLHVLWHRMRRWRLTSTDQGTVQNAIQESVPSSKRSEEEAD